MELWFFCLEIKWIPQGERLGVYPRWREKGWRRCATVLSCSICSTAPPSSCDLDWWRALLEAMSQYGTFPLSPRSDTNTYQCSSGTCSAFSLAASICVPAATFILSSPGALCGRGQTGFQSFSPSFGLCTTKVRQSTYPKGMVFLPKHLPLVTFRTLCLGLQ